MTKTTANLSNHQWYTSIMVTVAVALLTGACGLLWSDHERIWNHEGRLLLLEQEERNNNNPGTTDIPLEAVLPITQSFKKQK